MPAKSLSDKFPVSEILIGLFFRLMGALLFAMALVNLINASVNGQSLIFFDPLLGFPLRYTVLTVGSMELAVALVCLFGKKIGLQAGLVAWLITNFAVYRIGLLWQGCHSQWGCLGNPMDSLRLFSSAADCSLFFILTCMLLGGYAALGWLWLGRKKDQKPQPVTPSPGRIGRNQGVFVRTLKISCTACGGHIEFPTNFFGERIPCPHCKAIITLQKAKNLKMSCSGCDGHIEFPDYAIGQKISCPHCNTTITLKKLV
jgi:hypothetical protein